MLEVRKQRLVYQMKERLDGAPLLVGNFPIRIDPLEMNDVFWWQRHQTVHSEVRVDRVPALVHQRTGGQIIQAQMLEQFGDHLCWQIVDGR